MLGNSSASCAYRSLDDMPAQWEVRDDLPHAIRRRRKQEAKFNILLQHEKRAPGRSTSRYGA